MSTSKTHPFSFSYLNNIQNHIFVEAVQYAFGNSIVTPSTMDQQQLLQVGKLKDRKEVFTYMKNC